MNTEQGLIKWIILILIALIIAGYYGFDLRKAIEAPATQSNLTYVQQIVSTVWHGYLEKPATYLWNEIFLKIIWEPAMRNLTKIGNNQPTDIDNKAPTLNTPTPVP